MATDIVVIMTLVKRLATERVALIAATRMTEYKTSINKKQGYVDANADWQEVLTEIIEDLEEAK